MTARSDPHHPASDRAPARARNIRDLGDIILSLLPFVAIAVLIGIGAFKTRCGG